MKAVFLKTALLAGVCFSLLPCMGQERKVIVRNGDFEEGKKYWIVDKGTVAEIKRGYGRNGTTGVKMVVTPKRRGIVTQWVSGFVRNQKYEVIAWIKADRYGSGNLTMDVSTKKGKHLPGLGFYHGSDVRNKDWTMSRQFYHHKGEDPALHRYNFVLVARYSRPRGQRNTPATGTGTVWYDDIRVVPAIPEWTINQVHPSHGAIPQTGGKVVYSSFYELGFIPKNGAPEAIVTMKYVGDKAVKRVKATYAKDFISVMIPKGKVGPATISITLKDKKTGKKYGEKIMPLYVRKTLKVPPYAFMLDEKGRLWNNGKKFMPLGFYCNIRKDGLSKSFLAVLDNISKMKSFNTIMPYNTLAYLRSDKAIIRFLDEAHKRNLKATIPTQSFHYTGRIGNLRTGVKTPAEMEKRVKYLTNLVGKHPAFLAYYGNDEVHIDRLGTVVKGRKLLNKYDPFHPVWAVSYQVESYHKYLPCADILAYDYYPIFTDGINYHTKWFASRARALTPSVWGIPQCYLKDTKVPLTVENMLSTCAVHIIYEARGFIFYSVGQGYADKGDVNKRWGLLTEVGKILKEMESFIMSDIPLKKLKVKDRKEEVEAALLDNGKGEYRLVAVGIRNNHDSDIYIPKNMKLVSSKFGRIKEKAPGVITYTGKAVSCDFGVLVKR